MRLFQTRVVQDFSKEDEEEEEEKEDSFIDVLPSEVFSVDPAVGFLGTPLASACGSVSDVKGGASSISCLFFLMVRISGCTQPSKNSVL